MTTRLPDVLAGIFAAQTAAEDRGKVATYIPELASVDPARFGMAVVLADGTEHVIGDGEVPFSIQSVSKVFALAIALGRLGDRLWTRVGREPSGYAFNSILQLEHEKGIPRNPFINAGAIATVDAVLAANEPKEYLGELMRFIREAATISRLDPPHIVKVYDASPFPQGYFIVMEYFEATDLQSLIEKRGAPSVPVAVSVALQMCKALHYAGQEGIVHRDVKPANILYRADTGIAKLTDFGLAKRMGISAGTRDGEGVGTPCYMPPEQVNNARNVDHRADIYSLGASLYHLLSGRYPIIANNLQEFVQGILERDPPPIERFNPRVPKEICDVVRRAMHKRAKDRYQDGEEFFQALDKARLQYGIPAPPLLTSS